MATRVRVLIAVMRRAERQAVRLLLGAQPDLDVVGETGERAHALALAGTLKPNVMVVDLILPGLESLELLGHLNSASPQTRVIILRMPADVSDVARVSVADRLLHAVRSAAAEKNPVRVPMPVAIVDVPETTTRALRSEPFEKLTPREREVVLMAAEGLSSTETARRLGISPRTVETHRSQAMRKIGVHRRADLVRYAALHGILSTERDGPSDS